MDQEFQPDLDKPIVVDIVDEAKAPSIACANLVDISLGAMILEAMCSKLQSVHWARISMFVRTSARQFVKQTALITGIVYRLRGLCAMPAISEGLK